MEYFSTLLNFSEVALDLPDMMHRVIVFAENRTTRVLIAMIV